MRARDELNTSRVWKHRISALFFMTALAMGAGPGIYLVNPDPESLVAPTVFGMPVLYAWSVGWFGVMVVVSLVALMRFERDTNE